MTSRGFRWAAFLVGTVLLVAGCLPFSLADSVFDPFTPRPIGFLLQAAGLVLCWGFFPCSHSRSRTTVLLILGVSLLPRMILWPAPPSDDVHRYRWEGRLVWAGENPFTSVADDPVRTPFRDDDWDRMNHRERGTVYPPLAQLIFAGISAATGEVPPVSLEKAVFVAADIGVLLLLFGMLHRRRLPYSHALFYSLNPVVLVSFAGESHYDSLFILALVAAVHGLEVRRLRLSWVLLAASVQLKLISLLLLPVWIRERAGRGIWIGILIIALTWIPFYDGICAWAASLLEFGGGGTFQGLIPFLLRTFSLPEEYASQIGMLGGGISLLLVWHKGGTPATLTRRILGCLLVFSPILHFWYLSWILPFVALRPTLSWLWLCASQALYFLVWPRLAGTGYWELPPWAETLIWLPFLALGLMEANRFLRQRPFSRPTHSSAAPLTVGVVIPTYQAAETLPDCLASIRAGSDQPDEVLIVDGGSTDATIATAEALGLRTKTAPLGRGAQLESGIRSATTDWVLLLHADCTLHPEALRTIRQLGPEVVGGACGQRFSPGSPMLSVVEFMNEGRAVVGESYWGDQAMYLRRNQIEIWSDLHLFPLMEDVELARLMRRRGETRYLGLETGAGTAKWQSGNRLRRFILVFDTVIRFRIAAIFGRQARIANALYRRYYGQR